MTGALADHFEAAVDKNGDRVALDTPERTITYRELDARANQIAHWLISCGLRHGDTIGLAIWNRSEHVDVLLGALKSGVIPVNINCHYTPSEVGALARDANLQVIIHEPSLVDVFSACGSIRREALDEKFSSTVDAFSTDRPNGDRDGSSQYIIFTGGTTGDPKGVVWRQQDLIEAVTLIVGDDTPHGRVLAACPFTHGTAQWSVLATLLTGSTLVLDRPRGLDPDALWDRVAQAHVTRLVIVGDAFGVPLLESLHAHPDRWDLSTLVAISSGGARWSESNRLGLLEHLPHVIMVNSFGASETGGQGTHVTFAGQPPEPITGLMRFTSDGTTVVLDQNSRPIAPGSPEVGALARRGPIPIGYLGEPKLSARVFPEIEGIRYAIPGDLAMVDSDGSIIVLGRDRNVINSGGEKVFAEEVEGRLVRHPDVMDAAVVGLPDERWGERIAALVTFHPNATVTVEELQAHCATTLARFKIPRHIEIVTDIRHFPNGKLDRVWAADTLSQSVHQ